MKNSIDELLEGIDLTESAPQTTPRTYISLYVPVETKEKFDQLQAKSRKKFGKILQEIFCRAVDRAIDKAS